MFHRYGWIGLDILLYIFQSAAGKIPDKRVDEVKDRYSQDCEADIDGEKGAVSDLICVDIIGKRYFEEFLAQIIGDLFLIILETLACKLCPGSLDGFGIGELIDLSVQPADRVIDILVHLVLFGRRKLDSEKVSVLLKIDEVADIFQGFFLGICVAFRLTYIFVNNILRIEAHIGALGGVIVHACRNRLRPFDKHQNRFAAVKEDGTDDDD